ncbi:MAG: metallophosphoesterase [Verrucomicrobiota bacterium]
MLGPVRALDPFSLVVIPDTQYDSDDPATLNALTDWVVANREAENIAFVSHVGDLVEWAPFGEPLSESRWDNIVTAMSRLDGQVPYGVVVGNHDYDLKNGGNTGMATRFLENFGPERFLGQSWYRGASPDGLNSYQVFMAGGREFLHLCLGFPGYPDGKREAVNWAIPILEQHADVPTMITTHYYLEGKNQYPANEDGRSDIGDTFWEDLILRRDQVFMVTICRTDR